MTQNTQTTAERIATLINEGIDGDSGGALVGHLVVAQTIAAEIDALTAERDEAYAVLQKRTAERDGYLADVIFNQDWIADMQRRTDLVIAQVAKERDEAWAEVERLRPAAEAWEASEAWSEIVSGPVPTMDELDAASARLTKALIAARARAAKVTP